jgi:hypothetical protein
MNTAVPPRRPIWAGVTIQSSSRLSFRFGLSLFPEIRRKFQPRIRILPPAFSPDFSPAFSPWPWSQRPPAPLQLEAQGWRSPRNFPVFYFLPMESLRLAVASGQKHASPKLRSGYKLRQPHEALKVKLRWLIFSLSGRIR